MVRDFALLSHYFFSSLSPSWFLSSCWGFLSSSLVAFFFLVRARHWQFSFSLLAHSSFSFSVFCCFLSRSLVRTLLFLGFLSFSFSLIFIHTKTIQDFFRSLSPFLTLLSLVFVCVFSLLLSLKFSLSLFIQNFDSFLLWVFVLRKYLRRILSRILKAFILNISILFKILCS